MKFEKSIFMGDLHIPYQDNKVVKIIFKFMKWFKPDYIFLNGDLLDFYALSSYDKNPERINSLQEELDTAFAFLQQLRKDHKKAKIIFLAGNHENRLQRFLWKHPEIASLDILDLPKLLELERFNIDYRSYGESYRYRGLMIEHGNLARKQSGYTAAGMLADRQVSGLSNHVHRLGSHYKTDANGQIKKWYENGCLCDMNAEYLHGMPNWQHGFSVGHYSKELDRLTIEQLPIEKYKLFYQGKIWSEL